MATAAQSLPPVSDRQVTAHGSPVERRLGAFARDHGLYSGIYVHLGHGGGHAPPLRVAASSPVAYARFGEALPRSRVARRAAAAHMPFAWSWSDEPIGLMEIGHAAVTIPVQDHAAGPALVTLVGIDRQFVETLADTRAADLIKAAIDLHLAAQALAPAGRHGLTRREIECLRFAALGATVDTTARALDIASRTVEFHLKNAGERLGATNKVHAVAIAVSQGLLQL